MGLSGLLGLRQLIGITVLLLLLTLSGCGSDLSTVQGKVLLDGKPLDRGSVTLQAEGKPMGVGQIQSDGTFEISTGTQRGILPGKYHVTVTAYQSAGSSDSTDPIPALLTPAIYNSPETSDLSTEVKVGPNTVTLELKSEK